MSSDYEVFRALNMSNINFKMTYWHAAPGGLFELIMLFFDYSDNLLEEFRDTAQKLFDCRGIYVPIGSLMTRCAAVRLDWTSDSVDVELEADRDTAFDLCFPDEKRVSLSLKRGETKKLSGER